MAEVIHESNKVLSHKVRIAFFLAAMRHFANEIKQRKIPLDYIALDDPQNSGTLASELYRAIERHKPQKIVMIEAGEYQIQEDINFMSKYYFTPRNCL